MWPPCESGNRVEDPAKAIEIVRAEVQVNAHTEVLGQASEALLNAATPVHPGIKPATAARTRCQ